MEPIVFLGITVYPFGLIIALGVLLGLVLAMASFRKAKLSMDTLSLTMLLGLPLSLLCARLLYCICAYEQVIEGSLRIYAFTEGGYQLYGAIFGMLLAALIVARMTKTPLLKLTDALAAPGALMIAVGRIAEGMTGHNFGWNIVSWFEEEGGMCLPIFETEDPSFFTRFPFGMQDYYEEWRWNTWLVMALLAYLLCVLLLRSRANWDGGRTSLFLLFHASATVLTESLRQENVLTWGFVRCNQVISAIVIALVMVWLCRRAGKAFTKRQRIWLIAGTAVCMLIVVAMEFALEGKISAIEEWTMDVDYLFGLLACGGLLALGLWVRGAVPAEKEN